MPKITVCIGVLLIILGVGGYIGTGRESLTAMIPAAFGILLVILGFFAHRPPLRKHMMHAAAALALLGVAGTFSGVLATVRSLAGRQIERPVANYCKAAMAVICLAYVVLCVRSFINARRNEAAARAGADA